MNALSTFLSLPGSVGNVFHNASHDPSVPVAPGSETRAKRRRGRPWGRQIYTQLSARAEKALGRTVSRNAEVLRMHLIRRAGAQYPGYGEVPWTATLAWSGVKERQFRYLLAELGPTFRFKKVGGRLFYWSPFLADDQRSNRGWTNLARFNGLLGLEENEVPFVAEVRAHYEAERSRQREDRRAVRRGRGGKNIGKFECSPSAEVVHSETAKKKPFRDYCRDLSSKRIPEEEIPRPAGGSRLERWDLDRPIVEKSAGSSLTGGGPESTRAGGGVRRERERAGRPPLAKAPARPLAATETRPEGRPGGAASADPQTVALMARRLLPPVEDGLSFRERLDRIRELATAEWHRTIEAEAWGGVKTPRGG